MYERVHHGEASFRD